MTGTCGKNDHPGVPSCGSGPLQRIRFVVSELAAIIRDQKKQRLEETDSADRDRTP